MLLEINEFYSLANELTKNGNFFWLHNVTTSVKMTQRGLKCRCEVLKKSREKGMKISFFNIGTSMVTFGNLLAQRAEKLNDL